MPIGLTIDVNNEGQPRSARYPRSIAWALVAWGVSVLAVYLVAQVLRLPELGGWVGFAGFLLGSWFGGARGGITGRQEWIIYGLMLMAIALLAIGLGSCAYAMALYG